MDDILKGDRPLSAKKQAQEPLGRRRTCEETDGLAEKADSDDFEILLWFCLTPRLKKEENIVFLLSSRPSSQVLKPEIRLMSSVFKT